MATVEDEELTQQSDQPIAVDVTSHGRRPPKKITFPLNSDGRIDWDNIPDDKMEALKDAATGDEVIAALVGIEGGGVAGATVDVISDPNLIQPAHVSSMLEMLGIVERLVVPWAIKRKTGMELHPIVVSKCFRFTDDQKEAISKPGAVSANMLPETVRHWIVTAASPSEFFTLLGEAVSQQFENAMKMQMALMERQRAQQGSTTTQPPQESPNATP